MGPIRLAVGVLLLVLAGAGVAWAQVPPGGTFVDDDEHTFEGAIEAIAAERITLGCNPPFNDQFCPDDRVTRGQLAMFLTRAFGYIDSGGGDLFVDDDGKVYESAADRLKSAGVTLGCNPPANDRYCGDDLVTRGQMAAFLVRALGLVEDDGGNLYIDDDGSVFEPAIDRLGTAAITKGCNPPANDRFCPDQVVTRGQMAGFLTRALGLTPNPPPPRPAWSCDFFSSAYSCSGNTDTGDRIIEKWGCSIFDTADCSGDIHKIDSLSETWVCEGGLGRTMDCSGNIDKTDTLTEFWSCTHFSPAVTFLRCSGNINKADASAETWSCDRPVVGSFTCTGDIDKADTAPESWSCEVIPDAIDPPGERCSGDRTWLSPIVFIPFSI